MNQKYYLPLLLTLLLLKALFVIAFLSSETLGLGPDEAQYWTWSRLLDWGYYSKPPGIAWQIASATSIFGQTELGVRFFSVVFSFLQAIVVYFIALRSSLKTETAFWCALAMGFSPIGVLGSLFAITDGGFLLFWSLACLELVSALQINKNPSPIKTGLLIACGALFKWPIYSFWIIYIICAYSLFSERNRSKFFIGVLISLLGLLPSLFWNMKHDWATFRHVGATLQGGSASSIASGNPLEFLGSQIALLSPILFILTALATLQFFNQYRSINPAVKTMGSTFFIGFFFFFGLSFIQKIQGNWSLAIYPPAIILIGWFTEKNLVWLKRGVYLSIALLTLVAVTLSFSLLPYKMNPFKHNLGWSHLNSSLYLAGYNENSDFLFSDKYQTVSQISFYNSNQKRAYFMNLNGIRNNQFSYWPGLPEEQLGKTGYFIWIENAPHFAKESEKRKEEYFLELKKYFSEVEFKGEYALIIDRGNILKGMQVFKCSQYNGKNPQKVNLY
jgi:hypothetical protein